MASGYRIKYTKTLPTLEEAERIKNKLVKKRGGHAIIQPIASDPCPAGADHAHMRYDDLEFCRDCKAWLF